MLLRVLFGTAAGIASRSEHYDDHQQQQSEQLHRRRRRPLFFYLEIKMRRCRSETNKYSVKSLS